jgi:2-amino-4-hydroxy-6-hydroxymethyldihydropteridine diphosphokinase
MSANGADFDDTDSEDTGSTTTRARAYLSLGSNVEPERHLRAAIDALRARFGEIVVSPVYRVPAVGFDGPDFLNAAAIVDVDLDPFSLVDWLHGLERANGRVRGKVKFNDRTLDVDLVYFGEVVLDLDGLRLPRDEVRHAFVLRPLADIAPDFVDPVRHVSLAQLWREHPDFGKALEVVDL